MICPLVSIVVPTRNRARLLRGCLESLLAQDYPRDRYEIIVVDDGSADSTGEVVRIAQTRAGGPSLFYLRQEKEHRGVNAARNAGVSAARGEVIAFVDDDELVPSGYLQCVTDLLGQHPEAAGVGGPYRDYGPGCVRTCERCSLGRVDMGEVGRVVRPPEFLLGGNMALRKAALCAVGPFDEDLSGGGDETEWFLRSGRSSLTFFYAPELWIWHRKDLISPWELYITAFRQGLSVPLALNKAGRGYRPGLVRLVRCLGHATLRRCGFGLVCACREAGTFAGWIALVLRRARRSVVYRAPFRGADAAARPAAPATGPTNSRAGRQT